MGAKQSSPAANGRTRAYSGSDLPSSTSTTSNGNGRTAAMAMSYHSYGQSAHGASGTTATSSQHIGPRTRSVGGSSGGSGPRPQSGINIPNSSGAYSSQESGSSTPEEAERDRSSWGQGGPRLLIGSLPAHLSPHLFGEDVLSKDAGECAICLEELVQGDTIARLPCLCIYHKGCIDEWFEVNRSCPEHPSD
ncbi:E3 ubiquitin-protein ligase znrf2 isoform X2 [Oncorhynchus tshawytscha]|uniref:E3 ubiquitin-protein ligase znrf2 isoform X2 n=1 Tax=Oncorhynchus tshawytscha TaxID=74940 RepID=UPI000D0A8AED|nr:E3 ubiquitin-protein ligase znrf2 isoform X2 [Oncorhynchus tshawytscha]